MIPVGDQGRAAGDTFVMTMVGAAAVRAEARDGRRALPVGGEWTSAAHRGKEELGTDVLRR